MPETIDSLLEKMRESQAGTNDQHLLHGLFTATPPAAFILGLVRALAEIEAKIPGYAERTIDALASVPPRGLNTEDFDQILQRLAEVVVVRRLVSWGNGDATFEDEPVSTSSNKNPEVLVTVPQARLAVEVKTPRLTEYMERRVAYAMQFPTRSIQGEMRERVEAALGEGLDPRDAPLPRFLRSAEAKFAGFKADDAATVTVLVVVWDDFAHEALSALQHDHVGLLTGNSWDRDADAPKTYPNVDLVVVTGHQRFLSAGLREDSRTATWPMQSFDWSHRSLAFSPVVVANPYARTDRLSMVLEAFEGRLADERESQLDFVQWLSWR